MTRMQTTLFYHSDCLYHAPPLGHPESPDRLRAIVRALEGEDFAYLHRAEAPPAKLDQLALVHPRFYVEAILAKVPAEGAGEGWVQIDGGDTVVSSGSADAMLRAAGAVCAAVDEVAEGRARNAFCAVRPPGHHAEPTEAFGFCFFNNVAVGALHAREAYGYRRVAVVDFDVHHGNGTQTMFADDEALFYASCHQAPLFPGTGRPRERGRHDNIVNYPLPPGAGEVEFRQAWADRLLPALESFAPDFVLISAGFDGHRDDPLANWRLGDEDFAWVTREIMAVAERTCDGRIVSTLEGGYDLRALASGAAAHVRALMGA